MDLEQRVIAVIDKMRPFLISDGGNIEFIKIEDGIVYIKLLGACSHCSMIDVTLKEGIESMLVNEVPEILGVVNVDE